VIATQARRITDLGLRLGMRHESNIGFQRSPSAREELPRLLVRQGGQDDHIFTDLPVGRGDYLMATEMPDTLFRVKTTRVGMGSAA
jgi:hypothetical protein